MNFLFYCLLSILLQDIRVFSGLKNYHFLMSYTSMVERAQQGDSFATLVRVRSSSYSKTVSGAGVIWKLILDIGISQLSHYMSGTVVEMAGRPSAAGMMGWLGLSFTM